MNLRKIGQILKKKKKKILM